jgi:4-hydroxybenzoate polyprenyltransferase/phosphoserine phosphatase
MQRAEMAHKLLPLVVDLDGTLTPADTLFEATLRLLRKAPWLLLLLPLWLLAGRAVLKRELASRVELDARRLPYRQELLEYLREQRALGRQVVLATAADASIANAVAEHLGLFDQVLASDGRVNLKGPRKLEAIRAQVGAEFSYAGDSRADLPVWQGAAAAVLVAVDAGVADALPPALPRERIFPAAQNPLALWLRALRVHQWLKNLLVFVPLLTAFGFADGEKLTASLLAFLAFSCLASAGYLMNDLWDLDSDRSHPAKRSRPLASGQLRISDALIAAPLLTGLAFAIGSAVSGRLQLMLLTYLLLTCAYSWALKERVLLDVLMLSTLYTLRIITGAVAIGVVVSPWLLAFSCFLFLSLALCKRCAELVSLRTEGGSTTPGRGYRVADLAVLWPLGVGAALCAVVVFGLFIHAPETLQRYATPQLLWLIAMGLTYWLARLWIKTSRDEVHEDPIVFVLRDPASLWTVVGMVAIVLLAHFVSIGGLA